MIKLSSNIKKTKYMILHAMNKRYIEGLLTEPVLDNVHNERVSDFNFLGLNLNEHMSWKPYIHAIANKVTEFSVVLNKLKRYLPGKFSVLCIAAPYNPA